MLPFQVAFETNSVKVLLSYNSTLAVNVNLSLRSRPPKLVSDSGMQEWNLENVCMGNIMLVEFGIPSALKPITSKLSLARL